MEAAEPGAHDLSIDLWGDVKDEARNWTIPRFTERDRFQDDTPVVTVWIRDDNDIFQIHTVYKLEEIAEALAIFNHYQGRTSLRQLKTFIRDWHRGW